MLKAPSRFRDDALKLPTRERARLARLLILSLDRRVDDSQAEVEKAWDEEIENRVQNIRRGRAKGIPAEEVFAKLRARLG